jgi:hypothetical protein
MTDELHVDLYYANPLVSADGGFRRRVALDDPIMMKPDGKPTQLAMGWATYYYVSEPHTMADCPEAT